LINTNVKYGIKFSKLNAARFCGHLDLLKLFQRAINRSALPIAYSKGFNPHQLISFTSPLGLGFDSIAEYAELSFIHEIECEEITERLNEVLPPDIRLSGAFRLDEGEKLSMDRLLFAEYLIDPTSLIARDKLPSALNALLEQKELILPKKTKKGIKDTDIRPDILEAKLEGEGIKVRLSAGERTLKAELFVSALCSVAGENYRPNASRITRLALCGKDGAPLDGGRI